MPLRTQAAHKVGTGARLAFAKGIDENYITNELQQISRKAALFVRGACFGRRRARRRRWCDVHHFPGTRIVQLFSRLFLNRAPIGRLQRLDLLCIAVVFTLQTANLSLQSLVFSLLLPVNDHTVIAKHNMGKQPYCQHRHRARGQPASEAIQNSQRGTQSCHRSVCPSLSLRSAPHQSPQTIFRPRQNPDFGETPYSKIHSLVAAGQRSPKDSSPVSQ
jgi:hypothetical protein